MNDQFCCGRCQLMTPKPAADALYQGAGKPAKLVCAGCLEAILRERSELTLKRWNPQTIEELQAGPPPELRGRTFPRVAKVRQMIENLKAAEGIVLPSARYGCGWTLGESVYELSDGVMIVREPKG